MLALLGLQQKGCTKQPGVEGALSSEGIGPWENKKRTSVNHERQNTY